MTKSAVQISNFSESDLPPLSELHMEAFKGYKNAGIGRRYVREFLRWHLLADSSITLKAEIDGQTCGYIVGVPVGAQSSMNRDLLSAYAIGALTHPWVLLQRDYRASAIAKLKRVFGSGAKAKPVSPANSRYTGRGMGLVSMAVSPRQKGKGAGTALMTGAEQRAREMQYDYLRLSVYTYNDRARGIYERIGWELETTNGQVAMYLKPLNSDKIASGSLASM